MHARLAFGVLLALGVVDLAVINLHLAPQYAAQLKGPSPLPSSTASTVATVATEPSGMVATRPSETATPQPSETAALPVPTETAEPAASAVASADDSASATPPEPEASATATAVAAVEPPPTETAPPATAPPEPPTPPPVSEPSVPSSANAGQAAVTDIPFELDSYRINTLIAINELKKLAQDLRNDPGRRIVIRGHSDAMGTPEYNMVLSKRRADTVQQYLISHGAPIDSITVEAVGDKEPVDARNDPVAWARNRRVQVLWR